MFELLTFVHTQSLEHHYLVDFGRREPRDLHPWTLADIELEELKLGLMMMEKVVRGTPPTRPPPPPPASEHSIQSSDPVADAAGVDIQFESPKSPSRLPELKLGYQLLDDRPGSDGVADVEAGVDIPFQTFKSLFDDTPSATYDSTRMKKKRGAGASARAAPQMPASLASTLWTTNVNGKVLANETCPHPPAANMDLSNLSYGKESTFVLVKQVL
jgi:hypothetical protein